MELALIIRSLILFGVLYFIIAAIGTYVICKHKELWTDEFKQQMTEHQVIFTLIVLVYYPIGLSRRLLGIIGKDD